MSRLCLFDLDGTLTDPKIGITKSVAYALNSFDIPITNLDQLVKFIGPPLKDSFCKYYNFSEEKAKEAVSKYREYFSEFGIFENHLYDGIVNLLTKLKDTDMMMVIATSKPTVYAEKIAAHFDFKKYFDLIVGSEFDGRRSRKNEIINYALNKFGYDKKNSVIMIGDRKHDIIGGRETGIRTIGVTWGYGSPLELEAAEATWIVDSPDELLYTILKELPRGLNEK